MMDWMYVVKVSNVLNSEKDQTIRKCNSTPNFLSLSFFSFLTIWPPLPLILCPHFLLTPSFLCVLRKHTICSSENSRWLPQVGDTAVWLKQTRKKIKNTNYRCTLRSFGLFWFDGWDILSFQIFQIISLATGCAYIMCEAILPYHHLYLLYVCVCERGGNTDVCF